MFDDTVSGFGRVVEARAIKGGDSVRFRFVNLAAYSAFYIWFESADVEVIELDGVRYDPMKTKGFSLAPGQRISVILRTSASQTGSGRIFASLGESLPAAHPLPSMRESLNS